MSQHLPPSPPLNYATPFPPGPMPGSRFRRGLFGWLVFIGLAVMLFLLVNGNKQQRTEISLDEFNQHLEAGDIMSVTIQTDAVTGEFRFPLSVTGVPNPIKTFRTTFPAGTTGNWAFTSWLLDNRRAARIDASNESNVITTIVMPFVPWVLIFGFIWFFVFRNLRSAGTARNMPSGPIEVFIVNREAK